LSDKFTLISFASHGHAFFEQPHGHFPMVSQTQWHDELGIALLADYVVLLDQTSWNAVSLGKSIRYGF